MNTRRNMVLRFFPVITKYYQERTRDNACSCPQSVRFVLLCWVLIQTFVMFSVKQWGVTRSEAFLIWSSCTTKAHFAEYKPHTLLHSKSIRLTIRSDLNCLYHTHVESLDQQISIDGIVVDVAMMINQPHRFLTTFSHLAHDNRQYGITVGTATPIDTSISIETIDFCYNRLLETGAVPNAMQLVLRERGAQS